MYGPRTEPLAPADCPAWWGYLRGALGFLTFGGSVLTWACARSTHCAATSGVPRQASGRLVYPPIGRSAGPKGPVPSMPSSSARPASSSRTPTAGPNSPANMLPCTNAPRLPNIGLTSTAGSSGTTDLKYSLSASLGLGISMVRSLGSAWPASGRHRGLEKAEHGPLRVGDHGHLPDRGVERRHQDRAAQFGDLGRGRVRVGDREVHVPVVRHALHLRRRGAADLLAAHLEHRVLVRAHLRGGGGHPEHLLVERHGRGVVGDQL